MSSRDPVRRIRFWLAMFIAGLVVSGVTAFPLEHEVRWLAAFLHASAIQPIAGTTRLLPWIDRVSLALKATSANYPFLSYGTDWLAFAHLVIAIAFIGPYVDPVRNKWLITFGLIACGGVIPLALTAGYARGIPIGWRLMDCSFGIFGAVPLLICRHFIRLLEGTSGEFDSPGVLWTPRHPRRCTRRKPSEPGSSGFCSLIVLFSSASFCTQVSDA